MLDDSEPVAVKFLNPADVGTIEAHRNQFEAEIRIMRLCKHTNVVSCIGAWIQPVSL